ncbi:hypothetical protein CQ056_25645 [Peribacillus simplex]|nr:hypothetical protein CQ056_25645 [Peribacillus simplex]
MLGVFLCFRLAAPFEFFWVRHFHTLVYTHCNTVVMAAILIFDPVADSTQLVKWTYMSDKAGVIGIRKPDKKRWEGESAREDGEYSNIRDERNVKNVEETR